MAKKSNKTEQVLKLITKETEVDDSQTDKSQTKVQGGNEMQETETTKIKEEKDETEHKVEAKLKIEITPEIEVKQEEEKIEAKVQVSIPASTPANIGGESHMDQIISHQCSVEKHCLLNITEHLVKEKAKEIMERLKVCTCPECTLDVLALTLNSLPNKFITTDAGRLHTQLEIFKKQYETDVVAALTKACVRVKASPRHEGE